jgi:hypothetical protein
MTNLHAGQIASKRAATEMIHSEEIIVGGDDLVEAGDAQLADVLRIYREDSDEALEYRQVLKERGFETSRFKRPVLIRRRLNALTPEERMALVDSLQENGSAASLTLVNTAYGPKIARLMEGALPASVADALRLIAADWHRLRLAAKEGAPRLEVTPALQAAISAVAYAHAAEQSVDMLILNGALVDTGFTEAAFGFLRLMHDDAALLKVSDTKTIVDRVSALVLLLETQVSPDEASLSSQDKVSLAPAAPIPLAERASVAIAALTSGWAERPLLDTARLSATTDFDALRQVAAFNDLPAIRLMKRWLSREHDDPNAKAWSGVIAELWLKEMVEVLQRLLVTPESPPVVVDQILMVIRRSFDLEALACLAAHRGRSFDALPPDLRAAFARHGLDADAWVRIDGASDTGMIDPARLAVGDMERLSAMIEHASEAVFALDPDAFPLSAMARSMIPTLHKAKNGPFSPLFPTALAMTVVAVLALQVKRRMRSESELNLESPRAWVSAFLQSGAALLVGRLMARIDDAVDGFAHTENAEGLPQALAGFLQQSATGGPLWYACRGVDRLLWDALQTARGRDVGAAYARMANRYRAEVQRSRHTP